MENTYILIKKEFWDKLLPALGQVKLLHPPYTEIQIDQSIEERSAKFKTFDERVCYRSGAKEQQIIMYLEMGNRLEERITQLNQADAEFCKNRWDMTRPQMERNLFREESNKVTFARQELQAIQKRLIKNKKP